MLLLRKGLGVARAGRRDVQDLQVHPSLFAALKTSRKRDAVNHSFPPINKYPSVTIPCRS